MSNQFRAVLGGLFVAFAAVTSEAAPITFTTNDATPIPSYTEGGFLVTFTGAFNPDHTGGNSALGFMLDGTECFGDGCASSGSAAAGTYYNENGELSTSIRIETVSGNPFSFSGFDGAEGMWADGGFAGNPHWAGRIRVDATRADNTVVTEFFDLDGISDGPGGALDFQSFAPSFFDVFVTLEFTGAPGLTYTGNDFFIDNVNLSEVPEPSTWLLLASGLVVAARARRRR